MKSFQLKGTAVVLGTALAASAVITTSAGAAQHPFGLVALESGYMQLAEGKCGEGKCGSKKTEQEAKCGGNKAKHEGKCGEGKCGGSKTGHEGKGGEGKCGIQN